MENHNNIIHSFEKNDDAIIEKMNEIKEEIKKSSSEKEKLILLKSLEKLAVQKK